MQKIFFVVAVAVAVAGCERMQDKSAFEQAEVERRAEVREAQEQVSELGAEQRAERAELAGKQAQERADVASDAYQEIGAASANSAEKHAALGAERAEFQRASLERLYAVDAHAQAVIDEAATSTKAAAVTNSVAQEASVLKAKAQTLKDKLPAMMQVTSDATWTLTRDSVEDQLGDLEGGIKKLDRRL